MWSRMRRRPLKSVIIQVEIDRQPYPHDVEERRNTYGDTLASIAVSHFSQPVIAYYRDTEPDMLRHIEIGCFDGKKAGDHDKARHAAIVEILRAVKAFFASMHINCRIMHVLDTDMSSNEYRIMWSQKKTHEKEDGGGPRTPLYCPEAGIAVKCPMCGRSSELVERGPYPASSCLESDMPSNEEVEIEMTRDEYESLAEHCPASANRSIYFPAVYLCKDHGECAMSNANALVVLYTVFNHIERTAGTAYHVPRIFADGERIDNVYGE